MLRLSRLLGLFLRLRLLDQLLLMLRLSRLLDQ
jgi:hypothetical protein